MRIPVQNPIMLADCLTATCIREFAEFCGLKIPRDLMAEIISTHDALENSLLEMYSRTSESLDTVEREDLMDAVAYYFVGRHWPLYMENDDGAFMRTLIEKATAKGVTVVPEGVEVKIKTHWVGKTRIQIIAEA